MEFIMTILKDPFLIATFGGSCFALAIFLVLFTKWRNDELVKQRLSRSFEAKDSGDGNEFIQSESDKYQTELLDYIDSRIIDRFPVIGEKVFQAGYRIKAAQWFLAVLGMAICAGFIPPIFLGPVMGNYALLFSLIMPILVFVIARITLDFQIASRATAFDEQFGVGLDVMSASMRSGGTFLSSIKFVASGSDAPLSTQMGMLATELGLGTELPVALDRFKARVPSKNLNLFIVAVKVANQTGAALAPLFATLSHVITERFRLQGLINIGISQNLWGIVILGLFPWIVLPLLVNSWPDAYAEFFKFLPAIILTFGCFIWYCIGLWIMYKTVKAIDT